MRCFSCRRVYASLPLSRAEDARSRYPALPEAGAAATDRKPAADPYSAYAAPAAKDPLLGGVPPVSATGYGAPAASRAYGAAVSQAIDTTGGYGRTAAAPTMGQGMATGMAGGYGRTTAATASAYRPAPMAGTMGAYGAQQAAMATNGQTQARPYY